MPRAKLPGGGWAARVTLVALSAVMGVTAAGAAGLPDPVVVVTPAPLAVQPPGIAFVDPVFGTTLRRVSAASSGGGFETQTYSQLQAFSTDDTYLLLTGSTGYVVRRVADFSAVDGLDTSEWNAPRWLATSPHALVHFDSNADTTVRVQRTDVATRQTTTLFTFPSIYSRVRVNQSFDELSRDGRWLAALLVRNDGSEAIVALDLQDLTLGAELSVPALYAGPCSPDPTWGELEPDWLSASPLGRYIAVQWPRDGTTRCSGLETFDIRTGAFVGRVYDGHQHGDLGVELDGDTEIFMTFELYHWSGSLSIGVRALPGTATASPPAYVQILDWGNAEHISCRGPYGVCLVTAGFDTGNGWSAFEGELFLQYTGGSVLRLAHHRSSSCGYWVQPRASISRTGRYVVFASDWGTEAGCYGDGDGLGLGDAYVIDLWAGSETPTATVTRTPTPTPTPTPTVSTGSIGGRVTYYGNGLPVPATTLRLAGAVTAAAQTGADGAFSFVALTSTDWQVQPELQAAADDGAVSALDAAYVLQAVVGLRAFDAMQRLACDVTGDGTLSALDAARILQFRVGLIERLPVAVACGSDAVFVPAPAAAANQQIVYPVPSGGACQAGAIAYRPLVGAAAGQDFTAVRFGDCTGNWQPSAAVRHPIHTVVQPSRFTRTQRPAADLVNPPPPPPGTWSRPIGVGVGIGIDFDPRRNSIPMSIAIPIPIPIPTG
ncbi:dockerin type I repeat-containing protein [Candidatus Binatia bacterium]|nr:dockerin type I repeat-containing protein [Candidatus Binatia bacterium]